MYCRKCGKEINDDVLFCPFCGQASFDKQPSQNDMAANRIPSNQGNPKKKTRGPIIALIIFLCMALLGGAGLFFWKSGVFEKPEATELSKTDESIEEEVDNDSEEELLGLIDSAESIVQKSYDDYEAVEQSDDLPVMFQQRAAAFEGAVPELEELSAKASKIQGLDGNLKAASDHYFEMTISSRKMLYEMMNFYTEYFKFGFNTIPEVNNYNTPSDFYNALYDWYFENKDLMDSIEAPDSLKVEWNRYKGLFEINDDILNKLYLAFELGDFLRQASALNLADRYLIAEENGYQSMLDAFEGERDFASNQKQVASLLAEEMRSYCELDVKSRNDYVFEYDRDGKIILDYENVDIIYPALFNTYDAFVIFKTGCLSGTRNIVIEAEIPGFTQPFKQSYSLNSSYQAIYIKPPALSGDIDLSSAKDAQINISIYEKDGSTLIDSKSFPVTIKSINDFEWYTDEFGVATQDNILCFLTPDAEEIDLLKRNAITEISNMTGGMIESFAGYQEVGFTHYDTTYLQAAGIMRAMYDMGVRYDMSPFSISGSQQRIKLPEDVINKQSGLCIETSLTLASALQSASMHAFLIFPPGHAQVAVEVWGDGSEGTGEYFLIETTSLSSDSNNDDLFVQYANALIYENPDDLRTDMPISYLSADEWLDYLKTCEYIIDCNDSTLLGLTEFVH